MGTLDKVTICLAVGVLAWAVSEMMGDIEELYMRTNALRRLHEQEHGTTPIEPVLNEQEIEAHIERTD